MNLLTEATLNPRLYETEKKQTDIFQTDEHEHEQHPFSVTEVRLLLFLLTRSQVCLRADTPVTVNVFTLTRWWSESVQVSDARVC